MARFFAAFAFALCLAYSVQAFAADWGRFVGRIVAEWLDDGRKMRLLEPFSYVDSRGARWDAPKGSVIDGASIPAFAWSIIGGPFEGKYRKASVIHDVACVTQIKPWQSVHRAFYEAMLADGVGSIKAKTMYAAVYHFGPRWERSLMFAVHKDDVTEMRTKLMGDALSGESVQISNASVVASCDDCIDPDIRFISAKFSPLNSQLTEADFAALRAEIEAKELTLEQIDAYTHPAR